MVRSSISRAKTEHTYVPSLVRYVLVPSQPHCPKSRFGVSELNGTTPARDGW